MGSMMSAIANDEDDWWDLQKRAQLPDICKWKVYSVEARYVEVGFRKHGLRGQNLVDYVNLCLNKDKLKEIEAVEARERALLADLRAKYE